MVQAEAALAYVFPAGTSMRPWMAASGACCAASSGGGGDGGGDGGSSNLQLHCPTLTKSSMPGYGHFWVTVTVGGADSTSKLRVESKHDGSAFTVRPHKATAAETKPSAWSGWFFAHSTAKPSSPHSKPDGGQVCYLMHLCVLLGAGQNTAH